MTVSDAPPLVAGLILAGGEGRRFGRPKAFAELPDGTTFLGACFGVLRVAGVQPVVATLPPDTTDPGIDGLTTVPLPEPGLDMFASLKIGLEHLVELGDWRRVAVLPVDHPLVTSEAVATLTSTEAVAAIPSYRGKHGHPICLARTVAEAMVDGKMTGPTLREVLRSIKAVDISVGDVGVVSNCNTPEALREALDRRAE